MVWLYIALTLVIGYLLGDLNGAVLVSHMFKDDVRTHGSGNAGLTNFIRSYGATHALLVVAVDALKAVAACLIGGLLLKPYGMYAEGTALGGLAVLLGHIFPVFLGFRGGKGILSGLFVALVVDWRIAVLILAVFAVAYLPPAMFLWVLCLPLPALASVLLCSIMIIGSYYCAA